MKHVVAALFMLAVTGMLAPRADAESSGAHALQAKEGEAATKRCLTDGQIKQILIDESIAAYSGNCPCPYSTMSNGRKCGRRSAYSREGGEAPLCYAKDVTKEMVTAYLDANPNQ
jgi:hypothetical protein